MKIEKTETKSSSKNMKNTFVNDLTKYLSDLMKDNEFDDVTVELFETVLSDNKASITNLFNKHTKTVQKVNKATKDPNAPKRVKSNYIFFCIEQRDKVKTDNPKMEAKDITRELGRIWRDDLNDKQKAVFTKKSEKDKERYQKEMIGYEPPVNLASTSTGKKERTGPKKAKTSYICFCQVKREDIKNESGLSAKDITAELGRLWRGMDDDDKKPYVELADKDKERYGEEKKNWTGVVVEKDDSEIKEVSKPKKSETAKKKSDTTKPKKSDKTKTVSHKKTGFILFCQKNRSSVKEDNSEMSAREVTTELETRWKGLSTKAQSEYNENVSVSK